ncbi:MULTISPECIES: alginate O-acetyltransferase AlgF [unclassified Pseudomonas]|uniref:alginate O-acetyltransferase AlgF n=1 Tax=unclassified Pseudomonas TaxID=196821 RepID=UPI00244C7C4E|nr:MULTISPECIES: alginate O-acetyltransferase AlgF [unclassified Pseudomonas]MDH0303011.1 alginate O-acetyltransferase AlgF [Pseudomonas sp. GD04091]MDH1986330.1 alginate O-acetyltransferase AlgF [Pseudomonas sp. GD03689]
MTNKTSIAKALTLAAGLSLASMQAFAGADAALYGPSAPKGSTFVRLYNAASSPTAAAVGNTQIKQVGAQASSDFSFLPGGDYTAQVGGKSVPVKLAADKYYTLVNNSSGNPQLIEEPPFKNKQKALVRVQNLSDQALTLKTADGKTEVVKPVAAKGRGEREINPVKVNLALYAGDKKVGDVKPVALERGEAAVLYVTGSGSSLSPVWVTRPVATN